MRRLAAVPSDPEVARLILHSNDDGVYVFPCATVRDGSGLGDYWFQSVEDAEAACWELYGVGAESWTEIDDPLPGCQQDWVDPVRIVGRADGSPQWGRLERFEDGTWVEIELIGDEWRPKDQRLPE